MVRSKGAVRKSVRNELTNSVLRVGGGRGFVVRCRDAVKPEGVNRLVITAAHCLTVPKHHLYTSTPEPPCLPAAHAGRHAAECTYDNLLGPLGAECRVMAECLSVDPISDIPVLGAPDDQTFAEAFETYLALVNSVKPLTIADPPAIST